MSRVLVTGGNAGIGLALCKQLVVDHGCHVYICSRDSAKGAAAVQEIEAAKPKGCVGKVECVQLDASSDDSVKAAAATVGAGLGEAKLYAVVNNAGTGLGHGVDPQTVLNTNLYGPKRVTEAFLPLLSADARIVNVGSGAGGGYVKNAPPTIQQQLCNPPSSWAQVEEIATTMLGSPSDSNGGYGLSKACLAAYTMLCAAEKPHYTWSCCSPGFIATAMTSGFGATKTPEEGTVAIRKLLFEKLGGNGWYYGSDGLRSPYHFMRNPGTPEWDGVNPTFT